MTDATYELGAELPMPIGEELEQLQRQSDAGTYNVTDAALYQIERVLPSGYVDNAHRYLLLFWEREHRGCVITNAAADWHDGDTAETVLCNWYNGVGN